MYFLANFYLQKSLGDKFQVSARGSKHLFNPFWISTFDPTAAILPKNRFSVLVVRRTAGVAAALSAVSMLCDWLVVRGDGGEVD